MANELAKIIVKVGKKSNIRFSQCKLFRAIVPSELQKIANNNEDCNIVIIECVDNDEQDEVREFAVKFKESNKMHEVLFFVPDENEDTLGLADELDYPIYFTLEDLYKAIQDKFGINVSVFISDKKKYNSISEDNDIASFDIGGINGLNDDINSESTESTDDMFGTVETDTDTLFDSNTEKISIEEETVVSIKKEDIASVEEKTATEKVVYNETHSEDVKILEEKLETVNNSYLQALDDLKAMTENSAKLEKIIKVIREEKDDIVARFNTLIEDNDVFEEPISLADYEGIKEELRVKISSIAELTNTIEKLRTTVSEYENNIKLNSDAIADKDDTIEKLNAELEGIKYKIESGEIHSDVIADFTFKLSDANAMLEELASENNELGALVNTEAEYRENATELISSLTKKIADLSEQAEELKSKIKELEIVIVSSNESIEEYKSKFESADDELSNLRIDVASQIEEIESLKVQVEVANKRAELADSYADNNSEELNGKISALEANLQIVQEQLEYKENQYNELLQQTQNNSLVSEELISTNNTLDSLNKTLREKLGTTSKEIENYRSNISSLQSENKKQAEQIKRLTEALQSMSTGDSAGVVKGLTGGAVQGEIRPINYKQHAQIITVTGSGSHGITTTAMSLANKLSLVQKVLYIDFDLVTPNADAWFSKMPICRGIAQIPSNDSRMTGLGIFYEIGIETFEKYALGIINQCDRTKGGGIDYLSGVYYRVDSSKIYKANYTELFNFLGEMYQYIVIDLGRLGNSEVNDALIKAITDIASRNIVVTTCDKFDTRQFKQKLTQCNIDLTNIAWLVNMCPTTTLDEKTKQAISPCPYGLILFDQTLNNSREKFTRNKLNKDRFDMFVNQSLFGRR